MFGMRIVIKRSRTGIILSPWSYLRRPLSRAPASNLSRLSSWSFDNTSGGRQVTKYSFSIRNSHWWPRRKDGVDPEGESPRPDAEAVENSWNSAFEQRQSSQLSKRSEVPRRIHILGVGNVGLLIAHSLAGIPNPPPITFLTRSRASITSFRNAGECVELISDGVSEVRRGFDIEHAFEGADFGFSAATSSDLSTTNPVSGAGENGPLDENHFAEATSVKQAVSPVEGSATNAQQTASDDIESFTNEEGPESVAMPGGFEQDLSYISPNLGDEDTISNLIVSLKAKDILAIQRVAHRLTKDSAIFFVQNGMGWIDEVNEKIFPNPDTRPNYIIGVVSHGARRVKSYTVVHAGHGTIALSIIPRVRSTTVSPFPPSARYLLRTITRTPVLAAVAYGPTDLLQQQLEKLAVNCVINPLTAIMDCTNGELLRNFHITRIMRLLLGEISLVIRSLPELQNVPNLQSRFDPGRLELYTVRVASATSENLSSMLQDVRAGKETEIDYINGYIIRRGEELGIRCIMNYMLMHMLEAKQKIVNRDDSERLPIGVEDSLTLHT